MIGRPNQEEIEAMASLANQRDWQTVLAWLDRAHSEALQRMQKEQDDAALRQHQGAAQALSELHETAANARKYLANR